MEVLVVAAVGLALVLLNRQQSAPGGPAPPPPPSPPAPPSPPPQPKPPGQYPAGTPGTYPVQLIVVNPGGAEYLGADPGDWTHQSVTFWYGPGTVVKFTAGVESWAFWRSFDHFEGPGVQTTQNPFSTPIWRAGWVKAVFK